MKNKSLNEASKRELLKKMTLSASKVRAESKTIKEKAEKFQKETKSIR